MTALLSIVSTSSNSVPRRAPGPWLLVVGLTVVFCVAFAARLIPLLRGGGLHAMGNYDDGVHYAAAMGLVHGLLPYRDFLLLHPPGLPLLLTPFAGLAEVLGEPDTMVVARLCWMSLGALNAVLCGLVLLPLGRLAAVLTGLMYAVYFGAVLRRAHCLAGAACHHSAAARVGDHPGTRARQRAGYYALRRRRAAARAVSNLEDLGRSSRTGHRGRSRLAP